MVDFALLTSESKVSPLCSNHSIASSELCAAIIATQICKKFETTLKILLLTISCKIPVPCFNGCALLQPAAALDDICL